MQIVISIIKSRGTFDKCDVISRGVDRWDIVVEGCGIGHEGG